MKSINSIISFFLISCKSFNELTENRLVLQRICLTPYFSHLALQDAKAKKENEIFFFFSCYEAKNPHALLILGTNKYFLNEKVVEEKNIE